MSQFYNPYMMQPQMNPQMQQPMNQSDDWMQQRMAALNNRLAQNPQYQQYGQPMGQQPVASPISATPVTSMEEAKAAAITFDDREYLFVDKSAGKIYLKRWDRSTGGAAFSVFAPESPTTPQGEPVADSTANNAPAWANDIERLEAKITELEGKLNAKSDGNANGSRNGAEKPAAKKPNGKLTDEPKPDGNA